MCIIVTKIGDHPYGKPKKRFNATAEKSKSYTIELCQCNLIQCKSSLIPVGQPISVPLQSSTTGHFHLLRPIQFDLVGVEEAHSLVR